MTTEEAELIRFLYAGMSKKYHNQQKQVLLNSQYDNQQKQEVLLNSQIGSLNLSIYYQFTIISSLCRPLIRRHARLSYAMSYYILLLKNLSLDLKISDSTKLTDMFQQQCNSPNLTSRTALLQLQIQLLLRNLP